MNPTAPPVSILTESDARSQGYGPVTEPYIAEERAALRAALRPLVGSGIRCALVRLHPSEKWPLAIWRQGSHISPDTNLTRPRNVITGLPRTGPTAAAPEAFRRWILAQYELKPGAVADKAFIAAIHDRWHRWRAGDQTAAMPGYDTCPPPSPNGPTHPQGWSIKSLLYSHHEKSPKSRP